MYSTGGSPSPRSSSRRIARVELGGRVGRRVGFRAYRQHRHAMRDRRERRLPACRRRAASANRASPVPGSPLPAPAVRDTGRSNSASLIVGRIEHVVARDCGSRSRRATSRHGSQPLAAPPSDGTLAEQAHARGPRPDRCSPRVSAAAVVCTCVRIAASDASFNGRRLSSTSTPSSVWVMPLRRHAHLIEHAHRIGDARNVQQQYDAGRGHDAQAFERERLLLVVLQGVKRRAGFILDVFELTGAASGGSPRPRRRRADACRRSAPRRS